MITIVNYVHMSLFVEIMILILYTKLINIIFTKEIK